MLARRHVLGLLASLALPKLAWAEDANFLTKHQIKDLSRLKMSHRLKDGRVVESNIKWICEYYIRGTRYVYVSTTSDFPKNCFIRETVFNLDGEVIGRVKGSADKLDAGNHRWCCHGMHVGRDEAPSLWFIDWGPKYVDEALRFLEQVRGYARIAAAA